MTRNSISWRGWRQIWTYHQYSLTVSTTGHIPDESTPKYQPTFVENDAVWAEKREDLYNTIYKDRSFKVRSSLSINIDFDWRRIIHVYDDGINVNEIDTHISSVIDKYPWLLTWRFTPRKLRRNLHYVLRKRINLTETLKWISIVSSRRVSMSREEDSFNSKNNVTSSYDLCTSSLKNEGGGLYQTPFQRRCAFLQTWPVCIDKMGMSMIPHLFEGRR